MYKVTERGIESDGVIKELSEEDLEFIHEMFEEFSEFERADASFDETYSE